MKKQFITCLLALFSASVTTSSSFAQTVALHQQNNQDAVAGFQYSLTGSDDLPATPALRLNDVSSKAVKSFQKSFKEVSNPEWYAAGRYLYLATFNNTDGRTSRALFGKNGYLYYAINFGNEKSLPKEERRLIKSNYVDYAISYVSEVSVDGQKAWIVNLQDDNNLVIVKTANGDLEELAHYETSLTEKKHKKGRVIIPGSN